ncbi:MAG: GcrA family cell cycle regulator [Rhodomicrobium sp.]
MSWTDDRINTLKKLWNDGESASAIARTLGEVSRNAVIGKVHRLGLAGRANPSRKRSASRRPSLFPARAPSNKTRMPPFPLQHWHPRAGVARKRPPVLPELPPSPDPPVTVQSLTEHTCRWPEGDPKRDGFHFCGRTKARTLSPYCDHHAAIAFR